MLHNFPSCFALRKDSIFMRVLVKGPIKVSLLFGSKMNPVKLVCIWTYLLWTLTRTHNHKSYCYEINNNNNEIY